MTWRRRGASRVLQELRRHPAPESARKVRNVRPFKKSQPAAPRATAGEEDAYWELTRPRRTLTFEVKLAPDSQRVINDEVEQAEGAARAAENSRGNGARGVLITPHESVDETAEARLDRVRLLKRDLFIAQVERLLAVVREYRRGWNDDAPNVAPRWRQIFPPWTGSGMQSSVRPHGSSGTRSSRPGTPGRPRSSSSLCPFGAGVVHRTLALGSAVG